jgi:hypothetical protein
MKSHRRERIEALLADRALFGLSEDEEAELSRQLADEGIADDLSFDLAAAAVALAGRRPDEDAMPRQLADLVERSAGEHLAAQREREREKEREQAREHASTASGTKDSRSTTAAGAQVVVMPHPVSRAPSNDWTRWGGWAVAAAVACVFAGERLSPRRSLGSPADTRSIPVDVAVSGSSAEVRGTLSWSDASGRGQLHLRGLPPGDYEVWVADAARDARHPLAAGTLTSVPGAEAVADVASAITPRHATRLLVTRPTAEGGDAAPVIAIPLADP